MPGPNVLDLVGDIREAVERLPKEQLVDILTYVFKEYVVEGPAPLAAGPTAFQDDLAGMSFAEVIRSLQLRLDLPELELFDVQGERVVVRLQGRAIPVEAVAMRPEPAPVPAAPAPAPRPAPEPPRAAPAAALQQSPAAAPPASAAAQQLPAAPQQPAAAPSTPPAAAPPPPRAGLLEID